ncbi:MAG: phosphoglucomutase [Verrucomicrobiales bacterium]|jgi:phosphoglucomutase
MSHPLLETAKAGVNALDLSDTIKSETIKNLEEWLSDAEFESYRPQIESLIKREDFNLVVDCFYQLIPFGTGGRRGPVGVGPNRFNENTLKSSIQGHCEYLKLQQDEKKWDSLSVVVAYDVREFHDTTGSYDPEIPNPCLGQGSLEFARIAAEVYTANGITVWLQEESDPVNLATPELSFLIRRVSAQGGLNVSASHNPPDDNGAKLYNYTGGQEVPPNDEQMVKLVEEVDEVKRISYAEAKSAGLIKFITADDRQAYRTAVLEISLQPELRDAVVVFTPLHGAGKGGTGKVLEEAGFTVHRVESQWENCEGRFPNIPNHIANPEEPLAMVAAAEVADRVKADIAIATDPDADRFGALVADGKGGFRYLDGNELAAVVCHYVLDTRKKQGRLPNKPLVIKTEVTSSALTRIAEGFGAHMIGHLLVGFKYVGDILRQIDETGEFEGEKFAPDDYLFGCEESHGCLVTTSIRDKDSAGASLLIAELAAECKQRGQSVNDYLIDIYVKYGLSRNLQLSIVMAGATGQERMRKMLRSLRAEGLESIGGSKVTDMTDLRDETGRFGPIKSETDNISRNVLLFHLDNGFRVGVRPSGTEPKAKIYIEGSTDLATAEDYYKVRDALDETLLALGQDFAAAGLERAGVSADDPSVRVLGVQELEQKKNFDSFWRTKIGG